MLFDKGTLPLLLWIICSGCGMPVFSPLEYSNWTVPIVPHPQEIWQKEVSDRFVVDSTTQFTVMANVPRQQFLGTMITARLNASGIEIAGLASDNHLQSNGKQILIGELESFDGHLNNEPALMGFDYSSTYPGPEGYLLDISSDRVIVAGADSSGTYYGVQSLLQLIQIDSKGTVFLPPVTIIDYPDMAFRSAFYGFYLNAMENPWRIGRAKADLNRISTFKFNAIDLASHHYAHLEMQVPGHAQTLVKPFNDLFATARQLHLRPRVGGWAKWVNTNSPWGADLSTLEGIRTRQKVKLDGTEPCTLRIQSGHIAPNVMFDLSGGGSWQKEPVIVQSQTGHEYEAGVDYKINFAAIRSEPYRKYFNTTQTNVEVLFSRVHEGTGEPDGFPLRRGETFNGPTTIARLPGGKIRDGEEVEIRFSYIGPDPWSILKVRYCRSDERLHTDGTQNYLWRWCTDPVRFLNADDFSLDVDETRVLAWDKRCLDTQKSRSEIWASDIRYYYETIRNAAPSARISIWSDMIDPNHNGKIYGTQDVWQYLDVWGMDDLVMIPWKSEFAEKSIAFFAGKGYAIMPSSQEARQQISVAPKWAHYLREAYNGQPQKMGLMHCRWGYGFDRDETWEHLATVADHAWSVAPYLVQLPPQRNPADSTVMIRAKVEGDRFVFDGRSLSEGPLSIQSATLHYKRATEESYNKMDMKIDKGVVSAVLPENYARDIPVEYFFEIRDALRSKTFPNLEKRSPYIFL